MTYFRRKTIKIFTMMATIKRNQIFKLLGYQQFAADRMTNKKQFPNTNPFNQSSSPLIKQQENVVNQFQQTIGNTRNTASSQVLNNFKKTQYIQNTFGYLKRELQINRKILSQEVISILEIIDVNNWNQYSSKIYSWFQFDQYCEHKATQICNNFEPQCKWMLDLQLSICGDKIVVSYEDCDDGNLIPFDGCHHCKFFCDSTCKVYLQGKCIECENGFQKVQFQCIQIKNIKFPIQIKKVEINIIFVCLAQFESTCLQCQDKFNLNVYNNQCNYQQQEVKFNIKINNNYEKLWNIFKSNELNCKYYLNNYGCLECFNNFDFDSINNQCDYKENRQFLQVEVINVYDKTLNIIFKQNELNCKFFIKSYEYECLECFNKFSMDWMTKECHLICGDDMINGLEECEDSNQLQFDGCYDCQYQCCEYCHVCQFAKCKKCEENYYLASEQKCEPKLVCDEFGNQCYDICGDGIISKNEQCDDDNDIPFDGCYKCQFQCSKTCDICVIGECLIEQPKPCEPGFYYYFDTGECSPICGDGILALPFEECDDGNNQKDDECDNCLLQCNKYCKVCQFQNQCAVCQENYELINQTCLESQNNPCYIENCFECQFDLCLVCLNGFILISNTCQSICGDGILVGTEQCDDGNLINGDGCDEDCLASKNSLCKNQKCIFINPPSAKLIYLYEQQGEQFVMFQYNQKMRIADGNSIEDIIWQVWFLNFKENKIMQLLLRYQIANFL